MTDSDALEAPRRPLMIGIAGCSGSGKSTLATALAARLDATIFPLDLYYRDLSQFPLDARDKQNFDHPDSLESELFIEHLRDLAQRRSIQRPVYDFSRHTRVLGRFETVTPRAYVIVEGILALHFPELRALYDFSIYVDAPPALCLTRRIDRDARERGRTEQSVRDQFVHTTQPMAEQFVLPTKAHADLIADGCEQVDWSIDQVLRAIHSLKPPRGPGLFRAECPSHTSPKTNAGSNTER